MTRLAFATYAEEPTLTADDRLMIEPLRALGISVAPLVWDAGDAARWDGVVVRSCWDYHVKTAAFEAWVADRALLINPADVIRWNLRKTYLRELSSKGIPIPHTVWLAPHEQPELARFLDGDHAVIKPTISLSAFRTWRVDRHNAADVAQALASGPACEMMLQAFIPEILTGGELSFMFFDREFSHCVRKRPAPGDFRVQADFGGTRERYAPPPSLVHQAQRILDAVTGPLTYARVDVVDVAGTLVLMELELIDPVMFLAYADEAPARFARAIAARL